MVKSKSKNIKKFNFFSKKSAIVIIIILVIIAVITVVLYFTVFKKSSSNGGSTSPTTSPTTKPTTTTTPPKPTPPKPTPAPTPSKPFVMDGWHGWATTTKYGGETSWPGVGAIPSISMVNISSKGNGTKIGSITIPKSNETIDVIGTMGGAIPWAIFHSLFGWKSRSEYLTTVINSCNGTNPVPCCLIIQPIGKFPDEIAPTDSPFTMINGLCKNDCIDINDPSIVATYNNHAKKFPAYFVVPYEGCGGNCSDKDGQPDCFNSCSDIQKIVANFFYYNNCKDSDGKYPVPPEGVCETINWMSSNNYNMTPEIEQKFADKNYDAFSISETTQNGRNITNITTGFANYCSGKNMHIDVMVLNNTGGNPYWCDLNDSQGDLDNSISLPSNGSKNRGGNLWNTMVRYMLVPGNIFGNFNILDSTSSMPPMPLPTNVCPGGGSDGRCSNSGNDPNICSQKKCGYPEDCKGTGFPSCNVPWQPCP